MNIRTRQSAWTRNRLVAALVLGVGLLLFWTSLLTPTLVDGDAEQNLHEALNLARNGVISDSQAAPIEPSMQREPLPLLMDAWAIHIVDAFMGPADDEAYFTGVRLKLLKSQNLLWLLLLSGVVFAAARFFGLPFYGALTCVVLANLLLLDGEIRRYMLDSLLTEGTAAALLLSGSLLVAVALLDGSLLLSIAAGVVFGLLTLVKASFLYVTPVVAATAVVIAWQQRRRVTRVILSAVLLCAVLGVVVFPWMYRNYSTFGLFKIAGRGGLMLYTRGIMDEKMTWNEYIGGYYLWAPHPLNGALRRLMGFSREDTSRGGRVQRLNDFSGSDFAQDDMAAVRAGRPQDAITYFLQGEAENARLVREWTAKGDRYARFYVDASLQARGMELIRAHPWKELALTPLFLWRGALFPFCALVIAAVWFARRGELRKVILLLPAAFMIVFYAFVSFLIPRYSLPAAPLALVAAAAVSVGLYRKLRSPDARTAAPAAAG